VKTSVFGGSVTS